MLDRAGPSPSFGLFVSDVLMLVVVNGRSGCGCVVAMMPFPFFFSSDAVYASVVQFGSFPPALSRAPLYLSFPRRPLFFWIGTGLLMMLFDLFGCIDERVYSFFLCCCCCCCCCCVGLFLLLLSSRTVSLVHILEARFLCSFILPSQARDVDD